MKANAREKKVLYAGIAIAVVLLIYWAATKFSPGGDGESLAEKIKTQESLLLRQKELIGREDFYKKRIEDAENGIGKIQTLLLSGNNAGAATTELQKILTDFADHSGVVITTRNNLPERKVADSDSLIKISVRNGIQASSLADLVEFLTYIKDYEKFLKVEEMAIGTTLSPQRQMTIRNPINIVVAGYIGVPPPSEPGEDTAQATASASVGR